MLTIAKLKRWSINYYIDTARTAERATEDLERAGGGLGEYYSERETRTPVWLLAGDTHTVATLVGLTDVQRARGEADAQVVARWLDDGITPNGAHGRAFGEHGVPEGSRNACRTFRGKRRPRRKRARPKRLRLFERQ